MAGLRLLLRSPLHTGKTKSNSEEEGTQGHRPWAHRINTFLVLNPKESPEVHCDL